MQRSPSKQRPLLAVTPRGAHLAFVETSLRTDHIGVARVDGRRVCPCRLPLHDPLDLELSHPHHLPEKVVGAHHLVDDGALGYLKVWGRSVNMRGGPRR